MKPSPFLFLCIILIFTGCQKAPDTVDLHAINTVIGDKSFVQKYGVIPDNTYGEDLRIQTHLEYVEQLLRSKSTDHLTTDQRINRKEALDLLQDYWQNGQFPRNYDYEDERKSCFIDRTGNICAVGYLVEQTEGRAFAEEINAENQYSYIHEMDDPKLLAWAENTGLTVDELATIQPTYWPGPQPAPGADVSNGYGIASSVLSGANMAFNTINIVQIGQGRNNKVVPALGMLTGTGQVLIGAIALGENQSFGNNPRTLSYVNIGLGTGTLILSTYNLIANKKSILNKRTHFSVFPYETRDNTVGVGFSFSSRF